MLAFFRRYQRFFFSIVTLVVVASFAFYGTYSAFTHTQKESFKPAFTSSNGHVISQVEWDEMTLFLSSDMYDALSTLSPFSYNSLNPGVIRNTFLQKNLGSLFVELFPGVFPGTFNRSKEKNFKPYSHPHISFISIENIWRTFSPETLKAFESYNRLLRSHESISPVEEFQKKLELYQTQNRISPLLLRQILAMQENQNSWAPKDPYLARRDLALFGYHSAKDWFGIDFIRLIAAVIINASEIAEERGYRVSREEARAALQLQEEKVFEQFQKTLKLPYKTPREFGVAVMQSLGFQENSLVEMWQKILLFEKMERDVSEGQFACGCEFGSYFSEATMGYNIDLFQPSEAFPVRNIQDTAKLSLYLSLLTEKDSTGWKKPLSLENLEEIHSPLLIRTYPLRVKKVSLDTLKGKISIKDLRSWQVGPGWDFTKKEVPSLSSYDKADPQERLRAINLEEASVRKRLDNTSRAEIVMQRSAPYEKFLKETPFEEVDLALSFHTTDPILEGIDSKEEIQKLYQFLETSDKSFILEPKEHLLYSIEKRGEPSPLRRMSYTEAVSNGTLNALLQENYQSQNSGENFDDFLVNTHKGMLTRIRDQYNLKTIDQAIYWYLYDLYKPLYNEIIGSSQEGGESKESPFQEQFRLHKKSATLDLMHQNHFEKISVNDLRAMEEGEWSSLMHDKDGYIWFYKLVKKSPDLGAEKTFLQTIHDARGEEALISLMRSLIDRFQTSGSLPPNLFVNGNHVPKE